MMLQLATPPHEMFTPNGWMNSVMGVIQVIFRCGGG
jgi:hypothetical protein